MIDGWTCSSQRQNEESVCIFVGLPPENLCGNGFLDVGE